MVTLVANSKAATTTRKRGVKGKPIYALESGWSTPRILTRLSRDYDITVLGDGSGKYDLIIVTTSGVTQYALMLKSDLTAYTLFPLTATVVPFSQTPPSLGYIGDWYQLAGVPAQGWVAHTVGKTSLPVFVLVHGGPMPLGGAGGMSSLAATLAGQGAVAFCIDYRSLPSEGGGWPMTMLDVAAGITQARALAPTYGGDGSKVTLVAHSFGGYPSSVLALGGVPGVQASGLPDAYVAVAAISSNAGVHFASGEYDGTPDPISLCGNRPGLPVSFVRGGADVVAPADNKEGFITALHQGIHPGQNIIVSGADHTAVMIADKTIETILRAASAR